MIDIEKSAQLRKRYNERIEYHQSCEKTHDATVCAMRSLEPDSSEGGLSELEAMNLEKAIAMSHATQSIVERNIVAVPIARWVPPPNIGNAGAGSIDMLQVAKERVAEAAEKAPVARKRPGPKPGTPRKKPGPKAGARRKSK